MEKLVFKRRSPIAKAKDPNQYYRVRTDMEAYNMVAEIAEETGKTIKDIASAMIKYANKFVTYESEE